MRLDRRTFLLGLGAGAGWLATRGLGSLRQPAPFAETLRALGASLTPGQRAHLVFPADHPSRQINNTFSIVRGPHLGTLLSPEQQLLARALYASMLSERGRDAFQGTIAVEGRLEGCTLAIYGDPAAPGAQAVISGGHVLLRGGGDADAPLGGGVAYGHQIGNEQWRVPGNSFAYHGDAFNAFVAGLTAEERAAAILPTPPHELVLQPQAAGSSFPGLALARASESARRAAAALLRTVLSAYPAPQQAAALAAIEANGGVAGLSAATFASHGFYSEMRSWASLDGAERTRRGEPYWQVWRIEGPGTVIHFQGHPHVHAYLSIVRDPARANLGETLVHSPETLSGEPLRRLLEAALRRATGETLAFHGAAVPGRFCAGDVTTGLVYALDPYANHVAVATLEGRALSAAARERLGVRADAARVRVATSDYFATNDDARELGEPLAVEVGDALLRDALLAELRADGLAAARA